MKVFITGVAGFIGSHLAHYHLKRGDEVWGLDNFVSGGKENLLNCFPYKGFRFDEGNLLDWKQLGPALSWSDRVYHMAALLGLKKVFKQPFDVLTENIEGCQKILQQIKSQGLFKRLELLIASSSCVYGAVEDSVYKEECCSMHLLSGFYPQESYTASKMVNELMSLCFKDMENLHLVIARFFNVIGPNQTGKYGMVIPTLVEQALKQEPLTIYGDGKQTRSFCSIYDAIDACEKICHLPSCNEHVFNIGHPGEVSILDLSSLILEKTKSSSSLVFLPYEKVYGGPYHEIRRRVPNIGKLTHMTGFVPQISLSESIDEIIAFKRRTLGL